MAVAKDLPSVRIGPDSPKADLWRCKTAPDNTTKAARLFHDRAQLNQIQPYGTPQLYPELCDHG